MTLLDYNPASEGVNNDFKSKTARITPASESKLNPENTASSGPGRKLWQKGQSGNPGGRPKAEGAVRELARRYGPRAIRRLVSLMRSNNERVAVAACQALLDRGYGKAPISISGTNGPLVNINLGTSPLTPEQAYLAICNDAQADFEALTAQSRVRDE